MAKKLSILIIVLFLAAAGAAAWVWSVNKSQSGQPVSENGGTLPSPEPEPQDNGSVPTPTPEVITSDIDTSDWKTYRSEEYEFEVRYPELYSDEKRYSIWTASNTDIGLQWEWGVNQGQETIISVSVYSLNERQKLIDEGTIQQLGQKSQISDVFVEQVKYLSLKSYLIEGSHFIYLIRSSFSENEESGEYGEFNAILQTFREIK